MCLSSTFCGMTPFCWLPLIGIGEQQTEQLLRSYFRHPSVVNRFGILEGAWIVHHLHQFTFFEHLVSGWVHWFWFKEPLSEVSLDYGSFLFMSAT